MPLALDPHPVLENYPEALGAECASLRNAGGFSGARIWRCRAGNHLYCLRAWPPGSITPEQIHFLHSLMSRASQEGLAFVPAVHRSQSGQTWVNHAGRLWELVSWMPGLADFHTRPSPERLAEAARALAQIHAVWGRDKLTRAPVPAVGRRLASTRDWQQLVQGGWQPRPDRDDPLSPWVERAWRLLGVWAGRVPPMLEPWQARQFPLAPCLCDVWHDHLLFEEERLTGLIDYGAVKVDHPSVDLGRMLGSLVGDDREAWASALGAYRGIRSLSEEEAALAYTLDRVGIILGTANWLRWLHHEGRTFDNRAGILQRLAALVERMEGWEERPARLVLP
jgi:Ser/Thr protein kinase RdoA (MazF antagonist)